MFGEIRTETTAECAPGILTVDLGALADNYRLLQKQVGPVRVAGVVKANAYGLGAARIASALYAAGCRDFFVAQLTEVQSIRAAVGGGSNIYVLNGLQPGAETACSNLNAIPVLNSLEQIERWTSLAGAGNSKLPAVLQFDTGMSRLGLSPTEIDILLSEPARLKGIRTLFAMSHLASADEPTCAQNAEQLAAMCHITNSFPELDISFANTGGIFLGKDYHGAVVRPGIALYGCQTIESLKLPIAPVVRLDVRVIQTRKLSAGARVGYGGSYTLSSEKNVATLAAGYADGLLRSLSNRGAAYFGNVRLPILGRVSMDSLTVDISGLEAGVLSLGSLVEIIGEHQTLDQLAIDAATIPYEILTSLGCRYHRVYAD